jgi:hypothetical protein
MKKNKFSVLGMLTMVLTFGIVAIGCVSTDNGSGKQPSGGGEPVEDNGGGGETNNEPKTIVITGFNLPLEGKGGIDIELTGDWETETHEFIVHARGPARLNGQTLTCQLYVGNTDKRWTGTGEYSVNIRIKPPKGPEGTEFYRYQFNDDDIHNDVRVNIKDAETTFEWSSFKFAWKW